MFRKPTTLFFPCCSRLSSHHPLASLLLLATALLLFPCGPLLPADCLPLEQTTEVLESKRLEYRLSRGPPAVIDPPAMNTDGNIEGSTAASFLVKAGLAKMLKGGDLFFVQ